LLGIDGFEQEVHHAQVHGINGIAHAGVAGNDDDRQLRAIGFAHLADQVQAAARHHAQVGNQQRDGFARLKQMQGAIATGCGQATDIVEAEDFRQHFTRFPVVVDDQHPLR